jgi:2'-5' RNA ligase
MVAARRGGAALSEDRERPALAAWRDALVAGRDDLRPVPPAYLHVTLAFLGGRPEGEIATVAETGLGAVEGHAVPHLEPTEVLPVPARAPRLFALDLADPGGRAARVQSDVVDSLARAGLHKPERRPFWPHLTLARVRGAGRGRRPKGRVAPLEAEPPEGPLTFDRVTLYRSHLSPAGARYEALDFRRLRG